VARQVAEMLTKSETAIFDPFFRNRQVACTLRRLQSIPEQGVHAVRSEQGMHGLHKIGYAARPTWDVHPLLLPRVSD
jgi:hypothetical protein